MDKLEQLPNVNVKVEGDTIRVPHPIKKGVFVSFVVKGLTDTAIEGLMAITQPTREDLQRLKITIQLLPDPQTATLSDKSGTHILNEDIQGNLEISTAQYKKLRRQAIDGFLASRKKTVA